MKKGRKRARRDDELIEELNKKYAGDKVVPYMGRTNLPTDKSEFEYDKDRLGVILRCHENILYFAQHFFYIINLDEGKQKIRLHSFQRDALRLFRDNKRSIMCCSRQIGKTTLMTIYALWLITFFEYQRVVIVANKEKTAQEILERVKLAYEELPNWIKPTLKDGGWNKQEIAFSNGSKIQISATSESAIRGKSCNCVDGSSVVTLKDKETNTIFDISMEELSNILENNGEIHGLTLDSD